ncbi:hypothetical protein AAG570_001812 [Ranatra chinensis]|uniref:Nucleolar 27S pre-rRNA processing Urb2/Npa2 C-terminal domain-containing protein n=1 Tax=Ranatra chinensis TaxID=642074 RepID=A0ABD0YNM2_9HEMI
MAEEAVGLSAQLLSRLNNTDNALTNRLDIAQTVFSSPSIPVPRKEELVLQWICNVLESSERGESNQLEIYTILGNCLSSKRWMKMFAGYIRPTTSEVLLRNLKTVSNVTDINLKKVMQECIVNLLESVFYQRWFARDVGSLVDLISSCFASPSGTFDTELLHLIIRVEQALLSISRQCLLKAELRSAFIKVGLVPLARVLAELEVDDDSQPLVLFNRCFSQIVFYNPTFAMDILKGFQSKTNLPIAVEEFLGVFKKMPTQCGDRTVLICFTAYLRAVLEKFKDDSNATFHSFTYLCSLLGISVHKVKSISKKPIKNWSNEQSFRVMATLVRFLDTNGLPFNCDLKEVSLQDWFTCVLSGMVCINVNDLSLELLDLVHAIITYNPLVLENSVRSIAVIILQKKTGPALKKYSDVMEQVWKGAISTGRFQKIIARFLPLLNEIMKFSCDDSIRIADIFPSEVADSFCDSVSVLPNSQVLALMKTIIFHLETDCLPKLDNEDLPLDGDMVLPLEVISEILIQFLKGVRIADFSVSDVVQEKFENMKSDLEELMGKICSTVLHRSHNDRLLACLLKVTLTIGKLELVLRDYHRAEHKEIDPTDEHPTNLCYVHPYIPPTHWMLLAQRVENHNCTETKSLFKMEAVSQVEVGDEGPGTLAARYLLERAPPDWFWNHGPRLACLLEPKELLHLSRLLVQTSKYKVDMWIPIVKTDPFLKNRRWALATVLTFLVKIAHRIDKNKKGGTISKRVMRGFGVEAWMFTVLEYELSQCIGARSDDDPPPAHHDDDEDDNDDDDDDDDDDADEYDVEGTVDNDRRSSRRRGSLGGDSSSSDVELVLFLLQVANIVQEAITEPNTPVSENLSLTRDLHLLNLIPVQYFGIKSQTLIMLTLVLFLVDLPQDDECDEYIFNTMLIAQAEDGVQAPKHVLREQKQETTEIAKGYKNYRRFLERFIFIALLSETPSKQIIKHFKNPNKETVWITSIIIRTIIQLKKKKMDMGDRKDKNQVMKKLVANSLTVVSNEPPSLQLLAPFSTVIKHLVVHTRANLPLLIPKLEIYKELAIKHYKEDTYLLEMLLKHHSDLGLKRGDHLLKDAWNLMINSEDSWPKPLLNYAFHFTTGEEIETMFRMLLDKTVETLAADNILLKPIEKCFSLWCSVVTLASHEKQAKVRQAVGWLANTPFLDLSIAWQSSTKIEYVQPVLEFITTVAQTPSVELLPGVLDTCLLVLSCVPYPMDNGRLLVTHLDRSLDCLFAFYHFRKSLLLDRLPALLQRYRECITTLAQYVSSDIQLEENGLLQAVENCAYKIEKGTAAMTKRQKDFVRIAPHLVADLLQILEKYPMPRSVKGYYTNCVNTFLSLCDVHSIQFLSSPALPPPSQELFKVMYEDYKNFHKYTGKV